MIGVAFYEELENKRRKSERSLGTVVAAFTDNYRVSNGDAVLDALAAVYDEPDAPVCGTSVSLGYLRHSTRRISESRAREIHPQLFVRLDLP